MPHSFSASFLVIKNPFNYPQVTAISTLDFVIPARPVIPAQAGMTGFKFF
ncbi:hypothetical protein COXBURSA331_A0166 [Coxiella burnetii RSA 331]|nr:hypothetical protein COXBURSA331_A0166 [Coxiella burnetii RSA 331]